jgi:hypothetical protein
MFPARVSSLCSIFLDKKPPLNVLATQSVQGRVRKSVTEWDAGLTFVPGVRLSNNRLTDILCNSELRTLREICGHAAQDPDESCTEGTYHPMVCERSAYTSHGDIIATWRRQVHPGVGVMRSISLAGFLGELSLAKRMRRSNCHFSPTSTYWRRRHQCPVEFLPFSLKAHMTFSRVGFR